MDCIGAISLDELEKMKNTDIRNVNVDELVDIQDVRVDETLPPRERAMEYIRQIKNPYCYKSNGIVVKLSFAGKKRFEDCVKESLFTNL